MNEAIVVVIVGAVLVAPLAWMIRNVAGMDKRAPGRQENLVGIAVYGVMLALGVPMYLGHQVRKGAAHALALAAPQKAAIEAALRAGSAPPAALMLQPHLAYDAATGALRVTLPKDLFGGRPVVLVPARDAQGNVSWLCQAPSQPESHRRMLPEECR